MKPIIIALLIIINYQLNAQAPVLDSANFSPKVGDTLFSWNGLINNYFNPGNPGTNVFWDFSNINFTIPVSNTNQLTKNIYKYVNALNSNIEIVRQPEGVMVFCHTRYLSKLNSFSYYEYSCVGAGAAGGNMNSPNKKIIVYPFTFQDYYYDSTVSGSYSYPYGNNIHSHIYYDFICDGWGSLKILNNTHNNVLRIRYNNVIFDSSQTTILSIDTIYSWVKPYTYCALLSMQTTWQNNNGVWINEKSSNISPYGLDYTPAFMEVIDFNKVSFSIKPNPASDYIYIENIAEKARIEIYKMDGMLQQSTDVNRNSKINIRNLPDGLYLVKMQTDRGVAVKKFFKQ